MSDLDEITIKKLTDIVEKWNSTETSIFTAEDIGRLVMAAAAYLYTKNSEVPEWMPIESAPKNKDIDIWFQDDKGNGFRLVNCYWHKKAGSWHFRGEQKPRFRAKATYWMQIILPKETK